VAVEQIDRVDRLPAHLGIEVEAAGREAAAAEEVIERHREIGHVVRELVGVAAELRVTAVEVEAAEDAERQGGGDLVLEALSGQGRVVALDVDLELVLEPVVAQEAVQRRGVEVVLVLGRLARFSRAILDDTPVPTPLEDAVANMRVIDAVLASARAGAWVTVDQAAP
jgi:hypothetical protein